MFCTRNSVRNMFFFSFFATIKGKGYFQDVGDYFEYYKRQLATNLCKFFVKECFFLKGGEEGWGVGGGAVIRE